MYWLKEFHIDGLRVDAVSSMLYIDFERGDDKCASDLSGDRINRAAATFFKKLNSAVKDEFSDVIMIAEESGNYPMVTAPVSEGGRGFDLKWNMGWANDSFEYIRTDPFFRRHISDDVCLR